MDKQFELGKRYYFPLHGVGVVSGFERGVLKVDFRGIVAYLDGMGRPVYREAFSMPRSGMTAARR